uniref:2-aminoethanethiol dioxygenase n=1 Tax=Cacopsylla melanoneura TaxID=428564 RepID=A0A8D9BWB5_9HEMI
MSTIENVIKQAVKTFSFSNKDTLKKFNENFTKLLTQVSAVTSEDIQFDEHLLTQQIREVKRYRPDTLTNSIQVDVYQINRAPVTYIQIFENELVTLGVFVIREGNKLPLHNHPLMHGIIKVLAGTLNITSYSVLENSSSSQCNNSSQEQDHLETKRVMENDRFQIPGLGSVRIPCYEETQGHAEETDSHYPPPSFCTRSTLSYLESPSVFLAHRHSPLLLTAADEARYLTPREHNLHEIHCVDGPAAFLDVIGPPYKPVTVQDCTYFEDMGEMSPDNKRVRMLHKISCPSYFYTDEEKYKGPPIELT